MVWWRQTACRIYPFTGFAQNFGRLPSNVQQPTTGSTVDDGDCHWKGACFGFECECSNPRTRCHLAAGCFVWANATVASVPSSPSVWTDDGNLPWYDIIMWFSNKIYFVDVVVDVVPQRIQMHIGNGTVAVSFTTHTRKEHENRVIHDRDTTNASERWSLSPFLLWVISMAKHDDGHGGHLNSVCR